NPFAPDHTAAIMSNFNRRITKLLFKNITSRSIIAKLLVHRKTYIIQMNTVDIVFYCLRYFAKPIPTDSRKGKIEIRINGAIHTLYQPFGVIFYFPFYLNCLPRTKNRMYFNSPFMPFVNQYPEVIPAQTMLLHQRIIAKQVIDSNFFI